MPTSVFITACKLKRVYVCVYWTTFIVLTISVLCWLGFKYHSHFIQLNNIRVIAQLSSLHASNIFFFVANYWPLCTIIVCVPKENRAQSIYDTHISII